MKLKLATFFGIPLYLNYFTIPVIFLILLVNGRFGLIVFLFGLFFVILHEYGHCLAARYCGWDVVDVNILPIGGVARIVFKHDKPLDELCVTLAGPAVNLVLILLFAPFVALAIHLDNPPLIITFLTLLAINLMIMVFNLLPIFPLDGGRVLRALLSLKMGHEKATYYAVRAGQFGGLLLATVFIYFGSWVAAIIMVFMGVMAQEELSRSKLISALQKIKIKLANGLNKPELANAEFYKLIEALEAVQDEEVKERLKVNEILLMLKELPQEEVSV